MATAPPEKSDGEDNDDSSFGFDYALVGELTQAYLEATYEDGDQELPREEMHDLGALLFQLHWALAESPRAFTEVGEL